jgi:hypothetical protein
MSRPTMTIQRSRMFTASIKMHDCRLRNSWSLDPIYNWSSGKKLCNANLCINIIFNIRKNWLIWYKQRIYYDEIRKCLKAVYHLFMLILKKRSCSFLKKEIAWHFKLWDMKKEK